MKSHPVDWAGQQKWRRRRGFLGQIWIELANEPRR
jgi:hypothetical protein